MKHARWKSWFRLKPEASGIKRRERRAAFVVPLLEALEDRSLPSVYPVVTFGPDTLYQVVATDSVGSQTNASPNPQTSPNMIAVSVNYVGQNGIQFGQVTITGNVIVSALDFSSVSGSASFFALRDLIQTSINSQGVSGLS